MIHLDKVPYNDSGRDNITKLIREHMPSIPKARPGPIDIEQGEILSVWKLQTEVIISSAGQHVDLVKLAKPTGRWHHQIRSGGKINAWARSAPVKPGSTIGVLHRLSTSSLADAIERALQRIDSHVIGDRLLRLLEVPAFQLSVLWLLDETKGSQVFGIEYRLRFSKLETDKPYSSDEFLELLRGQKPVLGIRIRETAPKRTGRRDNR